MSGGSCVLVMSNQNALRIKNLFTSEDFSVGCLQSAKMFESHSK